MPPLMGLPTWIGISWKWATLFIKLAEDGECRLALFHAIRIVLVNEIYHFSRLSHQTSCIFTWAALSIESASHSPTSALSRRVFCKKNLKLNFSQLILLRMQSSLVSTFFPLVLVRCTFLRLTFFSRLVVVQSTQFFSGSTYL